MRVGRGHRFFSVAALGVLAASATCAQQDEPITVPTLHLHLPFTPLAQYGPYNAHVLAGGRGLVKPQPQEDPLFTAQSPWTLSAWIEAEAVSPQTVTVAGAGDPGDSSYRLFVMAGGRPALRLGAEQTLTAAQPAAPGSWHFLAATDDGATVRFFVDGVEQAEAQPRSAAIAPQLVMAPVAACAVLPCPHFGGLIAGLTLGRRVWTAAEVKAAVAEPPDADLVPFEEASKPWPLQVVQFAGNTAPQPPWTMPQRKAPFSKPVAAPLPPARTTLVADGPGDWILSGGWQLSSVPDAHTDAVSPSKPEFDARGWLAATVPGTVLTTMIDRGIYPDPDYGLNNLDIPEKLNRQSYWYRAVFTGPHLLEGQRAFLRFDGINYRAKVLCNGQLLGSIHGAFTRGVFDVTRVLHEGQPNAVAVLIAPPPHPGIPNVQSIAFGAGLNGGAMELDGPTFMAAEGWDWNPPMHDRDTGLWQNVHLSLTGAVSLGDPQVITHLPLPDISQADVSVHVPLRNLADAPVAGTLSLAFEGVRISQPVTVPPGGLVVHFTPQQFAALHLEHPRLWWPNGYGEPALYHLALTFTPQSGAASEKTLCFGVREITYELSLLDNEGRLRRVVYDPTLALDDPEPPVDVTHEGMREVPGGWAASIAGGQNGSLAFTSTPDTRATPYLTIRVNGVRIAVRGGSWGMDDARKRVSRARLEPFFRYDRDAHLDIIRNWQGQNTEETFYDLADEYGMLVWNDFWEVTTDSNAEAEDPQLFLANAEDTILRYRNHPSIAMWCGRNEGVPQPILNKGLIALTHTLDGTRYYSPSSNQVNLLPSGPYSYEDPADYFTTIDRGFAVEVGTSSLPTLEWFSRWLPEQDRWPIDDDWGYHNWHPHDALNQHMQAQFGAAHSLEQYVRQVQMMNYVDYRAIFEGFNAHLWAPNTGRLLWMTQPSWPSMLWGILSSDYDTQASYYGTKEACEPVHIQLDPSNGKVQVVNTTRSALAGVEAVADVYALDGRPLLHRTARLNASADDVSDAMQLDLAPLLGGSAVLVHLTLTFADGALLSRNLYWQAATDEGYRALDTMPQASITAKTRWSAPHDASPYRTLAITLRNTGSVAALEVKLLLTRAGDGAEVLPAFWSDNYVSLLPGEERLLTVDVPAGRPKEALRLGVQGWNLETRTEPLGTETSDAGMTRGAGQQPQKPALAKAEQ